MKNQFQALQNWTQEVLNAIKKDIKTDHLHTDPVFYRPILAIALKIDSLPRRFSQLMKKSCLKGNEDLAEWVVNRWVFQARRPLSALCRAAQRDQSQTLIRFKSLLKRRVKRVLEGAPEAFGAIPTFLFSVLNGVVFPESVLERLRRRQLKRKRLERKGRKRMRCRAAELGKDHRCASERSCSSER